MELKDLLGKHVLDAVDFGCYGDACGIWFRLDGVVYAAIENEEDGYRSSMDELAVSDKKMENVFPRIEVLVVDPDSAKGVGDPDELRFIDIKTGKSVVDVGTNYDDSYYPCFVANFNPENMIINADKK